MIRIINKDEARATVLRRRDLDTVELSGAALERNREIYGAPLSPEEAVNRIIADVRANGDGAVRDYCRRIDGVELDDLFISEAELGRALDRLSQPVREALELAASRVGAFHTRQRRQVPVTWHEDGLGQIVSPLRIVGCYSPGGSAPYPSTVLMTAIPAQIAGVPEIIVATPTDREGRVADVVLAACEIAGVSRVLRVGGTQAIAALTYGTESVPKVDKIVGPGNLYVVLAKKKVFGTVGIDGLHGPTETMLIADAGASTVYCAADMLAQAEHDPRASAILVTTSSELATDVAEEIDRRVKLLERSAIATESIEANGAIILVDTLDDAVAVANEYAPEHLCLLVEEPYKILADVKNAGGIFLGEGSFEVIGDYVAGPSHVMPTGGTARFSSPLNVNDFLKITSVVALDEEALGRVGEAAAVLARAEGLTAHAEAAEARLTDRLERVPGSSGTHRPS